MFDFLRETALSQNAINPSHGQPGGEAVPETKPSLQYTFLGQRVCRGALAVLMGVGWSPRLMTLLKAVLAGQRAAPVDARYMTRKHSDPRPVYSEVYSYLESLYMSVAETLPLEDRKLKDGLEVWSDDEDAYCPTLKDAQKGHPELRYLTPGTIYDLWRQYNATSGQTCSWHCFHQCWKTEFAHKMTFRDRYMFSVCPTCVQHKLLLRGMGADSNACLRQRMLYDRHLASQFNDRKTYWSIRAQSRLHERIIVAIVDGMDQGKYATPRSGLFKGHSFDKYTRPRLHVWGLICHGYMALLSVSDADVSKGGSTTAELIIHMCTILLKHGIQLQNYDLVLQLDNTTSSNKNNTLTSLCGVLAQRKLVRSARLSFLRVGHTHEDQILPKQDTYARDVFCFILQLHLFVYKNIIVYICIHTSSQ